MFAKDTVAVMVTVVTNANSCHHKITIFEGHRLAVKFLNAITQLTEELPVSVQALPVHLESRS